MKVIAWFLLNYSSISSGFLSGGLHAITGPDHFTALLPIIIQVRWWRSSVYGGSWGLGHGLCSLILGLIGCTMKGMLFDGRVIQSLFQVSFLSDLVIGLTIIVVASMGMLEAIEEEYEEKERNRIGISVPLDPGLRRDGALREVEDAIDDDEDCGETEIAWDIPSKKKTADTNKRGPVSGSLLRDGVMAGTVCLNGFVMGLSWDGLPSLGPSILFDSPQALAFLLAYMISTAMIMAVAAGLIGEASHLLSRSRLNLSDSDEKSQTHFSHRLTLVTSLVAFGIGSLWLLIGVGKGLLVYFPLLSGDVVDFSSSTNSNDGVAMMPASNDGIEVMESRLADEATASLLLTSEVDLYCNLLMSSLSLLLMVGGVVVSVFAPDNSLDRAASVFAHRLHDGYEEASVMAAAVRRRVLFAPLIFRCLRGGRREEED